MKKTLNLIALFILDCFNSEAQSNFVPNSVFDTITSCPSNWAQTNQASPWIDPANSTPDLFNICSTDGNVLVPSNAYGNQSPFSGNGYAELVTYVDNSCCPNAREYIQAQLFSPLVAGKIYCVSFMVSWADSVRCAVDGVGAYFSANAVSCSGCFMSYPSQINNTSGNVLNSGNQWVQIQGSFIASGGEDYITIGNFKPDTATIVQLMNPNAFYIIAYYYIDNVSVVDCGWSGMNEARFSDFYLSPNPSNGEFQLKGNFPMRSQLHVYDLLGNEAVPPVDISEGEQNLQLQLKLLSGMYIYRIISDAGILAEDRLVIVNE